MTEEQKPKCDIDDLMCQMQALSYLDGLQDLLGTEKFQERYPEFKGLGDVVRERMGEQKTTIKEMMERCGLDAGGFVEKEAIETEPTVEEE